MADDRNSGYSSQSRNIGQMSASDQERMTALAFSQEIINNAHAQADRVLKAAERQAREIVEKARQEADEIVRRAEEQAAELPDSARTADTARDDARLRAYAARCAEVCMADLRRRQQETLAYMDGQFRQLLSGLAAGEAGPESAPAPRETVPFSNAPLSPDAESDVSLGQIEEKVSAIAQQLAAFAQEEPEDAE